jgi:protein-S-isoprenylcysteine O-methyltransferase Ste14
MGDKAADPIDHYRTTRAHAGQNFKNTAAMPGLVFVVFAVIAFVLALATSASRHFQAAEGCIGVAVLAAVIGSGWLYAQRRRVRNVKAEWLEEHPEAYPAPPDA